MTRFPVIDLRHLQALGMTHHLVDSSKAKLGHQLTYFLSDEHHEIDQMCWLTAELSPQLWILRCHTNRTGIQVTSAHHDASERHQRRRRKAKLFCTKQSGYNNITTCFQLPVSLDRDATAQIVEEQRLMCFSETELPRSACMLDAGEWRCPRAALVAANQDYIRARFCDAGRDRADSCFGHKFHTYPRFRICVLQVVNELGQV